VRSKKPVASGLRGSTTIGESEIWPDARPYNPKEGPPGGSHLLHRSIFEKVGNYDEAFGLRGEDTDLYRRICKLGIVSWYTPNSICHHMIPPDRLTREYFQTTALHDGWAFAQRDRRKKGAAIMAGAAIARIGQAACINMPRLAKAKLAGDPESVLDAEIRLWIAEGFTRSSLYSLAPNFFRQTRFFSRYEFRPERRFLPQA
jgi:GT2 family glycosyltransferase